MKYAWRNLRRYKNEFLSLIDGARTVVVFDTETTGLTEADKVIQFAGIRYRIEKEDGETVLVPEEEFDRLINPEVPLDKKITKITGFTDLLLQQCKCEKQQWNDIKAFLESGDIWAAYNKDFDIGMMSRMAIRCGDTLRQRPSIDVLVMARDCVPATEVEKHKLGMVAGYLCPGKVFKFHDAFEDVQATADVLAQCVGIYRAYKEPDDKIPVELNWASLFVNPQRYGMIRIKTNLSTGRYGDIFFDVMKRTWSCCSSSQAERLFKRIDLADLEDQLLKKYAWRYKAADIDQLAAAWSREKLEKIKAEEKAGGKKENRKKTRQKKAV